MIGPIEAKPTKPKLSLFALLPPLTAATPAPRAKINGTVAEPVVTPPESKINGKNAFMENRSDFKMKYLNFETKKYATTIYRHKLLFEMIDSSIKGIRGIRNTLKK
jgi:hypothetical protein